LFKIMGGTSGLCTMMHSLVHYNVSLTVGVMITEKNIEGDIAYYSMSICA